jgi:hypothetical protein
MKKFEHKEIHVDYSDQIIKRIRKYEKDGWQLVCIYDNFNKVAIYFKREIL